jgi:ankyrin repeat protein
MAHKESVRLLISFKAGINAANKDGQSPLSVAAQKHHSGIVAILLQQGSVPDSSIAYGQTALILAVAVGSVDVVEQLLKAGANANFKTIEGDTAVSLAQELENDNASRLLRQYGGLLPTELNGNKTAVTLDSLPERERVEMQI